MNVYIHREREMFIYIYDVLLMFYICCIILDMIWYLKRSLYITVLSTKWTFWRTKTESKTRPVAMLTVERECVHKHIKLILKKSRDRWGVDSSSFKYGHLKSAWFDSRFSF